jgi:hypothetical protein
MRLLPVSIVIVIRTNAGRVRALGQPGLSSSKLRPQVRTELGVGFCARWVASPRDQPHLIARESSLAAMSALPFLNQNNAVADHRSMIGHDLARRRGAYDDQFFKLRRALIAG